MYKEIKKLTRVHTPFITETVIAQDRASNVFASTSSYTSPSGLVKEYTQFKAERNFGAGISFKIAVSKTRYRYFSMELGKQELQMLIEFLQSQLEGCKDYNGEFVDTELLDIK